MMTQLNKQQLSFLLKIKQTDARDKMVYAYCRANGEAISEAYSEKEDPYPDLMPIEMLANHLNIPDLQNMVDDISNNFLTRHATRGWISEYPQKIIERKIEAGDSISVRIPSTLRSFLTDDSQQEILKIWKDRYAHVKGAMFS